MYFKFVKMLSMLLIIIYLYKKTKDRIFLWVLIFALLLVSSTTLFRIYFPDIQLGSPTVEYTILLIGIGVAFIILVILIGIEAEKRRADIEKNIRSIIQLSKDNIIFWTTIILMNIIAFLLDRGR